LDVPSERRFSDAAVLEFLQRAAAAGAIACVHAENGEIIELLLRRTAAEARTATRYLNAVRPPELEGEATGRMIALADLGKVPLYLTGLSSAHALEKVKAARDRGQPVYAETCPHYLVLGSERYEETDGIRFYCTPPLRPSWHQDVLWKGVTSGDIQVVASDHAAFNLAGQKDAGKDNFSLAPPGLPGIQERLSLFHSAGVTTGRMSVNRYVDMVATTPARLFGLFPRKGTIAVGSDADMVIFDPRAEQVLSRSISLSRSDFCAFEGIKVRGAPWLVLLRGRVISREGKVMGRPGSGEFIPRARFG
ncbi:MAG: amidohydrolase family protein, partial [Acidobacteria bacterium]|nr:amidohydrolase family protein [Acidobacteriota bacterium]